VLRGVQVHSSQGWLKMHSTLQLSHVNGVDYLLTISSAFNAPPLFIAFLPDNTLVKLCFMKMPSPTDFEAGGFIDLIHILEQHV
jgi:hypothetical protein